ncbi:glycosyltransferase [Portibacter marinus]|uniref:glycosyltransferase n=1 Tax=Portibacter marinus TaxID=2898660 RepID=UPI001F3387E2|nr:nucleotide disphospho-sugar-binding domain-containing protein [Portibacter marinus]
MAHILCITSGLTGISNASLELCKRLQNEGNTIVAGAVRDKSNFYELNGFEFVKFPEIKVNTVPKTSPAFQKMGKIGTLLFSILFFRKRRRDAYIAVYPDKFIEYISRHNFDAIIIDIELHEFIISAYALKQRVILLSQWFSIWRSKGLPYLLTSTIPNKENLDAIEKEWDNLAEERRKMNWMKKWLSFGTDRRTVLKRMARNMGFPRKFIELDFWPGIFHYDQLPVFSMTLEGLEFPHEKRPNLFYIGPMVFEERKEQIFEKNFITLIEDQKAKGQKIIVGTFSTLNSENTAFFNKLVSIFRSQPEWSLFIGISNLDYKLRASLPQNVFVFNFLPQIKALRYADISINHGGIHTINECIHFGVPMLVYSGGRSDQNGCAARIQYHQVGLRGDRNTESDDQIKKKIRKLLSDENFQNNVLKFQKEYLLQKQKQSLTKLIDQLELHYITETI